MTENQQNSTNPQLPGIRFFIVACFIIFLIWLGSIYYMNNYVVLIKDSPSVKTNRISPSLASPTSTPNKEEAETPLNMDEEKNLIWARRGTIGDSFGAVNALFSGFAFAGALYAIWLQREDLKRQRIESKEAEEKQKIYDEKQQNNFNAQLDLIKQQTQAISNQLGHDEQQTEAIKKQVTEFEKQTIHLAEQIMLSITPAFVATLNLENHSGEMVGGYKSENIRKYKLNLINIGNGTAVNINIEAIELTLPDKPKIKIDFKSTPYLDSKQSVEVVYKVFTKNSVNDEWGYNHELNNDVDKNLMECLKKNDQTNHMFTLEISFLDIKNTKCTQEIIMEKDKSIPRVVRTNHPKVEEVM